YRVKLATLRYQYAIWSLIGPKSQNLIAQLGVTQIPQAKHSHITANIDQFSIRLAADNSLNLPGYTLIVPQTEAATLWSKIIEQGVVPLGENVWEQLRIHQGRPAPSKELTEDYNPLEAGLWQKVSFDKGCYIGQETIARLNTYKGVKQRLWGVKLTALVAPGTPVTLNDSKVGALTSCIATPAGNLGLAYIRTKVGGEGLKVEIGQAEGEIIAPSFLNHEYVN
ncbi:MAG: folate-binding protein, partial [Okeania sp. SIO2D1]|nr:folate-binding protein [Okeania sp. SIO2D1]